jgi:hypothetical protein
MGDADEDEQAWLFDRAGDPPVHGHAGLTHPLYNGPHEVPA